LIAIRFITHLAHMVGIRERMEDRILLRPARQRPLGFYFLALGFLIATPACSTVSDVRYAQDAAPEASITNPVPSKTTSPTANPTSTSTGTLRPSPTIPPTSTVTETPLPPGAIVIPELIGMPYSQARKLLLELGFMFLFQDVLHLEYPHGTIIDQNPQPGVIGKKGDLVFLFRGFHALQAYAGGACIPLRLITTGGRLLYWVELIEDERYTIKTDFDSGSTTIHDYRMVVLKSFDNASKDTMTYSPETPGYYVISLGPYSISDDTLKDNPGGVPAGCLWISPVDEG